MANPVTVAHLEARWRPFSPEESLVAQSLLDDAWEEALARVPTLEERLTDLSLREGLVIKVFRDELLPILKNPEGFTEEALDDWRGVRASGSDGLLCFSDESIRLLGGGPTGGRAFEIWPGADDVAV